MGTNYTWKGLQENGLNYEPQRDYERLEEASLRAGKGKSERAESPQSESRVSLGTGTADKFAALEIGEADRVGSVESNREIDEPITSTESGIETRPNISAVQPVQITAEADERFIEAGDEQSAPTNERILQRLGEFDSGETEAFERTESETLETIATAKENAAATSRLDQDESFYFALDTKDEYFRELEANRLRQQQSQLFDPATGNYISPAATGSVSENIIAQTNIAGAGISGTGNENSALVSNGQSSGQLPVKARSI